jgi:hypothetical protein
MTSNSRGFALLLSVILTGVSLAIGLALLDVAYKQVLISVTSKQSALAFYNADSSIECALYYDQKSDAFNYSSPAPSASILCGGIGILNYGTVPNGSTRTTTFYTQCPSGNKLGYVTVVKNNFTNTTDIYASGYSSCSDTDPRRIERALKAHY